MREYIQVNPVGGGSTPVLPWVEPSDWIDISVVGNNEINLLVTNSALIAFITKVNTGTGTFSVDWGDGIIEDNLVGDGTTVFQHQHLTGGTSCSLGYNTWKIRIFNASGNITIWKIGKPNNDYVTSSPVLSVNIGASYITNYASTFSMNSVYCYRLNKCVISSFIACGDCNMMFLYCNSLKSVQLPSSWGGVSNTNQMFVNCYSLESINIPATWGTGITNTSQMFQGCTSLTTLTLPATWGNNISNVSSMFINCYSLSSITLPTSWNNISNVSSMFQGCGSLQSITLPSSWGGIYNIAQMFVSCTSLKSVNLPAVWGVSITSTTSLFSGCGSLKNIILPTSWGSVSNIVTMFYGCTALQSVTFPTSWGSVSNIATMFYNCTSLITITFPTSWGDITNASSVFQNCTALQSVTLPATWGNVNNTSSMLYGCASLASVDLSSGTNNITNFSYMFYNCPTLKSITNLNTLGSLISTVNGAGFLGYCALYNSPIVITSLLSSISFCGSYNGKTKITSIRLTNAASTFTGSAPHVDVSYNELSQAALVTLFGDLPTLVGKTINITQCTGAAALTAGERAIATGKGWTITG